MPKKIHSDLPFNLQAEKVVLGAALINKEAVYNILSSLEEDDFYDFKSRLIYKTIKNLAERHIDVDVVTVTEELINLKELENIGGVKYLQECSDSMVAISSLDFYINIVQDESTLRKLLVTIRDIDEKYKTQEIENINDFIAESEAKIKDATEKRRVSSFKTLKDVTGVVEYQIDAASKKTGEGNTGLIGLDTGYPKINSYTQGFKPGEFIVLAARPSVGKTALALNFAYKISTRSNVPVAIFSLEMPSESLAKRLIASASLVSLNNIYSGKLTAQEKSHVMSGMKEVANAPIYIDDSSNLKVLDIVAKCRKLQAKCPNLGLVIIDYLGLVAASSASKSGDSRQEEVRKISLTLKGMAKDLKIPVIAVCQLSRDVEKRDNKRPMMSDLRESGSIEQDADIIMLLYRGDYYSKYDKKDNVKAYENRKLADLTDEQKKELFRKQEISRLGADMSGDTSYIEVDIAKNRNGKTGTVGLFFYKSFGKYDSPSKEWEAAMENIDNSSSNNE